MNPNDLQNLETRISEMEILGHSMQEELMKLEEYVGKVHKDVKAGSTRHIILTPSAIAIAMAYAYFSPENPVYGIPLAIAGLIGLLIGTVAPNKWLIKRLKIRF